MFWKDRLVRARGKPGNQVEEAAKLLRSHQVWKGMGGNIKTLNLTLQVVARDWEIASLLRVSRTNASSKAGDQVSNLD